MQHISYYEKHFAMWFLLTGTTYALCLYTVSMGKIEIVFTSSLQSNSQTKLIHLSIQSCKYSHLLVRFLIGSH